MQEMERLANPKRLCSTICPCFPDRRVCPHCLHRMNPVNFLGGWNVLDVANNKVLPLSHDFLATSTRCDNDQERKILAADGGLLVVWYGNRHDHSLIVCNPLLKAVKVIPPLQDRGDFGYKHNRMIMSTDRVSMEYKIVVFHPMENDYFANYMDIFESKIGRWRRVVHTTVPSPGWWYRLPRVVKLKNALYRLYSGATDINPHLIKFDTTTNVGSRLDIAEVFLGDRECSISSVDLVVSRERLFCVYRSVSYLESFNREPEYLEILKSSQSNSSVKAS